MGNRAKKIGERVVERGRGRRFASLADFFRPIPHYKEPGPKLSVSVFSGLNFLRLGANLANGLLGLAVLSCFLSVLSCF